MKDLESDVIRKYFIALGKQRARGRRRISHACEACGNLFEGLVHSRFCSAACRLRAHRDRQRGKSAKPSPPESEMGPGLPPLVARLDATCAAISRGRVFEDSTKAIRAERDARTATP